MRLRLAAQVRYRTSVLSLLFWVTFLRLWSTILCQDRLGTTSARKIQASERDASHRRASGWSRALLWSTPSLPLSRAR